MNTQPVLIVDDDEGSREYLGMLLEQMGFRTLSAKSGAAAVDILRHTTARLMLLDINMPGMSGLEVLRLVRERLAPKLPIVMTTASGDPGNVRYALDVGANDYVLKPIQPELLRARLRKYAPATGEATTHCRNYLADDDLRRFRRR